MAQRERLFTGVPRWQREIFRTSDVAEIANVAPRTAYTWFVEGLIGGHRTPSPRGVWRVTRGRLIQFLIKYGQSLGPIAPHIGYYGNPEALPYTTTAGALLEMQAADHLHVITAGEVSPIDRWMRDVVAIDERSFGAAGKTVAALQEHHRGRLTIITFRDCDDETPIPWANGHRVSAINRNNEPAIREAIRTLVEKGPSGDVT